MYLIAVFILVAFTDTQKMQSGLNVDEALLLGVQDGGVLQNSITVSNVTRAHDWS